MGETSSAEGSARPGRRRSSLRIGRLLGIDILVHWSFALLVVLVVAADSTGGPSAVGRGLLWVVAIFACVLVHELAHCVVAQRDGVVVDDILLLPIGGVSEMRSIPAVASEELAIAVAGPLASLALAVAFAAGAAISGGHLWPPALLVGPWLVRLAWLNLLLGAFNLLPALPMDGGRVLRAALTMREDRARATATAAKVARFLAVLMIVAGLAFDVWLVLIGVFVLLAAGAEERAASDGDEAG
jgi:Zn-dependent protease